MPREEIVFPFPNVEAHNNHTVKVCPFKDERENYHS